MYRSISYSRLIIAALVFPFSFTAYAQSPRVLTVRADKPATAVQPTMWGIFFEDINFAADGGLYAELIKNRSFEFANPKMGWQEHKSDRFSMNRESG
jgi:alpha-N-arabinofuranosidase